MKKLLYAKGELGTLLQFNRLFLLLLSKIVTAIDLAVVIFVSFFLSFFFFFFLLMYFWTGRGKMSHPESAEAVDGTKLKEKEKGTPFSHSKYFENLTISYFNKR